MKRFSIFVFIAAFALLLTSCSAEQFIIESDSAKLYHSDCLSLVNTYPHDTSSFTQGLFFHGGELYESTGLYGQSKMFKNVDIKTGKAQLSYDLPADIFGEGSVVFNNKLFVLSWIENKVFVLDPDTLELLDTLPYARQGWGLTTNGKELIASDGSANIYFMDETFSDIRFITVKFNDMEVTYLNELEYIDGFIWANVWLTNDIVIIDPESGNVVHKIDFTGLNDAASYNGDAVLNGIAYDSKNGKLFITGKLWDSLYEFELK